MTYYKTDSRNVCMNLQLSLRVRASVDSLFVKKQSSVCVCVRVCTETKNIRNFMSM